MYEDVHAATAWRQIRTVAPEGLCLSQLIPGLYQEGVCAVRGPVHARIFARFRRSAMGRDAERASWSWITDESISGPDDVTDEHIQQSYCLDAVPCDGACSRNDRGNPFCICGEHPLLACLLARAHARAHVFPNALGPRPCVIPACSARSPPRRLSLQILLCACSGRLPARAHDGQRWGKTRG